MRQRRRPLRDGGMLLQLDDDVTSRYSWINLHTILIDKGSPTHDNSLVIMRKLSVIVDNGLMGAGEHSENTKVADSKRLIAVG